MLDRWYKIAVIAASAVVIAATITAPSIGGIFWLAQLNHEVETLHQDVAELQTDVAELQTDVAELQTDVAELQRDVAELQRGQAIMLEILQNLAKEMPELRTDLDSHIHGVDGQTRFPAVK